MQPIRRLIEIALYGVGDQRRFVQDGAIFPEVWIALLESGGHDVRLLLQPFMELPPGKLAEALSKRRINAATNELVYNNTLVSLKADLDTIVFGLAPMTYWFSKLIENKQKERKLPADPVDVDETFRLWVAASRSSDIWADLPSHGATIDPSEPVARELLSFVRAAGVASFLGKTETREEMIGRASNALGNIIDQKPDVVLDRVAEMVIEGWRQLGSPAIRSMETASRSSIYSITNDRQAFLAVVDSRRTVKADAATRLFELSSKAITWAVVDSGIDALHPAFCPSAEPGKPDPDAEKLKRSRVTRTYDFSCLREILLGKGDLPARLKDPRWTDTLRKVQERADDCEPIDWGLLLPLLRVENIQYWPPRNSHGTHVAGILGADWKDAPRGPMQGICPDIKLYDIRVCKENGYSDEFIITASLQFLRYLNAHADMMAVHGVNISLSLEHDVANYACGRTPVCLEAEKTMGSGIVVVAAAGNRGYRHIKAADETTFYQYCAVSITDPGNTEAILTVGSTHRREPHNFGVSYFSSRGPTGDGRIKPDIVAPGEKIYGPAPGAEAITLDGTSMAAPHVSGAAALLLARNTELIGQPARVKKVLCETATDLGREHYFQGHGLVDILRALQSV